MQQNSFKKIALSLFGVLTIVSCSKDDSPNSTTTPNNTDIPVVYKKIYGATSITNDGIYITIKSTGLPDHKSVYYETTNPLYEAFSGSTFGGNTFKKNPNSIAAKTYTFKIPLDPKASSTHAATPLGAIGVAINGVPLYNQYAAPNTPLTSEVVSFDQYRGHPSGTGSYHYHVEPLYLTTAKATKSSLLGFLLDGFPVYGPEENAIEITNAMLDGYHGHTSVTPDYPNGIYHYHINNTDPYINGSGFYGTPGTVTQ
jgi:hypothetical protein